MSTETPTPPRRRPPAKPLQLVEGGPRTTEAQLIELMGQQLEVSQKASLQHGKLLAEQTALLGAMNGKLDALDASTRQVQAEVAQLKITPRLLRVLVLAILVGVVLTGIGAGAQVALSTGWLEIRTQPGGGAADP